MPSPIGHALGGVTLGLLAGGLRRRSSDARPDRADDPRRHARLLRVVSDPASLAYGALGALPDVDFAFGAHNTYTHSLGAALVVGIAARLLVPRPDVTTALAVVAAYSSHILLDWLGRDTVEPLGVMALWPFSASFYQSDLHWFLPIRREYWEAGFVVHTLRALAWEIAILGPLAVLAAAIRHRRR